jgi:hypothetical protein
MPALIVLLVAAVVVGAVAIASSREPGYPSAWDARVRPIATRVEALRGLTFAHPVNVHFLPATAFDHLLAGERADASETDKQVDQTGALLRAMGLLGTNVDLPHAVKTIRAAATPAFYDDETKQLYVRGTGHLAVDQRVGLAHELTRALQDQAFDLGALRRRAATSDAGSVDAVAALTEGDAARIQARYVDGLSQADHHDYGLRSLAAGQAAAARTAGVPAVVAAYFDAADAFGSPLTRVLVAEGGNPAIDNALRDAPPSTRIFLDPGALKQTPPVPPVPGLLTGERALPAATAAGTHFENYAFYLMLAARLDLPTALRAADTFQTGSQVAYSQGGRTCFRAVIEGVTRTSSSYLADVLRRWAATMPDAGVSFTADGVLLHSCDPGARAVTPPDERIQQAVRVATARDDLVASLARQPLPTRLAVCAARVLVQHADFRNALLRGADLSQPTPQMVQESADAGRTCRANPRAGLP